MRRTIAILAAALLLTACGETGEPATQSSPSPSATAAPTLVPGAFGPVEIGMTVAEAEATGLLTAQFDRGGLDECEAYDPMRWLPPYDTAMDVFTDPPYGEPGTPRLSLIGVWEPGPETETGVQVGDTEDAVIAAYPDAELVEQDSGYGHVFVAEGEDWLGIVLETSPDGASPADGSAPRTVRYIELTSGTKPELNRSGC